VRDAPSHLRAGYTLPESSRPLPPELKCRGLDGFPVSVAHGLAASEHFEPLDLLGIVVKNFTLDFVESAEMWMILLLDPRTTFEFDER